MSVQLAATYIRHEDLGVLDLLLDEIAVPSSQAIVVNGEAL